MGDWVNEAKIDDPEDKKPEDWATEAKIKDPEASKPDGWDDDEDGEWEAPIIDNPAYKGEWKARQLDNPDFVKDVYGFDDIGSVGYELWTVNAGSVFDNIFVSDNLDAAFKHADEHWAKIKEGERDALEAYDKANKPPEPEGDDADGEDLDDEDGADMDEEDL